MNLTAIFLLAGCLQVTAGGFSQTVTLSREDTPLEKVFLAIKKQTGYSFFYNAGLLKNTGNIDINVKGAPLAQVLAECLKDEPLTFSIINKTIVILSKKEAAMNPDLAFVEIKGKITDQISGEPIAGANISVKNTSYVVASNDKGTFQMNVNMGAVLVVSYVGYISQTITVTNAAFLNIKLKPDTDKKVEEMVITGYQKIRKESYTGNEVTVTGDELKRINPLNLMAAMQAYDPSFRVADNNLFGSDPNRLSSITVRGSTTIPSGAGQSLNRDDLSSNYNLPTFILDGYAVNLQKVFDLDINRIQTVTLLKDAAATAVYGSRAANGVMVITTKAPKDGKLQLSYNYEMNIMAPDLTGYDVLDAREKLEYERLAGLYLPNSSNSQSSNALDDLYYQKKTAVESGVNTYWLSQPLRTAVGQKHSAYIEGGSSSFRYGIDLRHQTTPGVMKGSERERNSLGMTFSYNPSKKFIFKNELTVTQIKGKESPYGEFRNYVTMNPYYPKTDSDGRLLREVDSWMRRNSGDTLKKEIVLNPLYEATLQSFQKTSYIELINAFIAEWNITNALRLRSSISVTKRRSTGDFFKSPLSNDFYFYSAQDITKRGSYDYSERDETGMDGTAVLTYNKQIGDHFFNFATGANIIAFVSDFREINAIGFTNDRFTSIGFSNSYRQNAHPVSDYYADRLFGTFLSGNYAFRNKYLLDLSVRVDGSSKFGTENKTAPFWAVGLGWNAHKEDFMPSYISQFKLRASAGLLGAVSFPPYLSKTTYSYYTDSWYSTGVGAGVTNYGNENIQWQRTRTYDIGLDLGLFKDRLFISPRYYYKLTTDLLADIVLPPSTGFGFYKDNLGDMLNSGIEVNLRYEALRGKNYRIMLNANLAHNKNEIKKISNALTEYNKSADNDQVKDDNKGVPLLRFKEGQSLNTWYAVRSLGIDPENGKEIFINRNDSLTYVWDVKDIVPVGDLAPKAEGFFGSTVSYKGFMVNLSFYYRFGGKTYNQTLVDRVENADPRYNVDARALNERWKNPGDVVFYKNIQQLQTSLVSSRFIQKDNLLELRSVYASYDFSPGFYSKLRMKNLRLAFTANDVFRTASLKAERGIIYPYARNFTVSLQTSF